MLTAEEQQGWIRGDHRQAPGGRPRLYEAIERLQGDPKASEDLSVLLASIDSGDTPVQQQFGEEVDINVIVRRFGVTAASSMQVMGVYGDFTDIENFDDAVRKVEGARARFSTLPPEVRDRFGNDPGALIEAATTRSPEEFARLMDPPKVEPVAEPPVA